MGTRVFDFFEKSKDLFFWNFLRFRLFPKTGLARVGPKTMVFGSGPVFGGPRDQILSPKGVKFDVKF